MFVILSIVAGLLVAVAGLRKPASRPWMIATIVFGLIGLAFPPAAILAALLEVVGLYKLLFA